VCAQHGYFVTATVVGHGWSAAGSASRRWSHHPYFRIEFRQGRTRWSRWGLYSILIRLASFFDLVKTSPFAPRLATMRNVMALPGAVAFKSKNAIVGALGVGGAPGGDKDEVCAQAGVAKVADRLPN
jgi:uncharacterized protein GlcG (DUF336 family)